MKLAGIDGVIVDWYGMDDYLDYGLINQSTTNLSGADWATVDSFQASTSLVEFSARVSAVGTPAYFRVKALAR